MSRQEQEERPKPLSFYIAGPFSEKEKMRDLMDRIEEMGHRISFDRTTHLSIKPKENPELAAKYAKEDMDGAADCDVFILIPGEEGGGTQFAELGAAIVTKSVKRVFVVEPYNDRLTAFFYPKVERVNAIEEVFMKLFPHG